ncbi:MAG: DUF418 domain-containing protein [Pyrinomonadaceae bacterium]
MISNSPTLSSERIEILDVLRGIAIFGILIGNMQWFSGYGFMPPAFEMQTARIDQITHFLVHFFVEGKFYSVFSFLFGFGFAMQIAKAGDANAAVFKRRLFWLLIIGLLHAYLLWSGDILSIYALMGFVLVLFRNKSDRSLLKWSAALMVIPILTYILLYVLFVSFAPTNVATMVEESQAGFWNDMIQKLPQSNYLEIVTDFNLKMIVGRYAGLIFEMRLPKILAMFLLGFYAHRRGFFQNLSGHRELIRRVLIYGLVLGLVGNIIFSAVAGSEAVLPPTAMGIIGVITYGFGVPAMALFYIAAAATLWQRDAGRRFLGIFAPVGRMALTNYLLQTVICVLIFYGYGFGMFGSVRKSQTIAIATAIFLFQIVFSYFWLRQFQFGPMEWIWRQLTYKKSLPLKRVI